MIFNPNPDADKLKAWCELAYIDDDSRKQILAAPFGKYKEARAGALKFVETERIRWAIKQAQGDSRGAAKLLGMPLLALEKKANSNYIKFTRGSK